MSRQFALILTFFECRTRSFLRRECPLLYFIPPLVAGQMVGYELRALHEHSSMRVFALVFIVVLIVAFCARRSAAPFLLGILGMALSFPAKAPAISSPASFFATLKNDARHRQIGAIEGEFSLNDRSSGNYYGEAVCRAIYLPWKNIAPIQAGDTIVVQASMAPIELPYNPAAFEAGQRRHGISASCRIQSASRALSSARPFFSRLRESVFLRVTRQFGSGERVGLFLSMVLGFRDQIGGETFHLFQSSGLAHLLVVSGYHVTLIFTALFSGFRHLIRRVCASQPQLLALALALSCSGAIFFVGFIGVDGASLRAAIAVCVVVASRLFERGSGLIHAIMLAFLLLCLLWPGCFLEPGIQLTFAALTGIAWGLACRSPRQWVRYLAVCVAPSITTLGVTIVWFGNASIAGFLLNPLLAPVASMLFTIGGLVALLAMLTGIDPTGWLMQVILCLLDLFKRFICWAGGQEWAAVEFPDGLSCLMGSVVTLIVAWLILKRVFIHLIEMGVVTVE